MDSLPFVGGVTQKTALNFFWTNLRDVISPNMVHPDETLYVVSVLAHRFASLAARLSGFVRREFVRSSTLMRGLTTLSAGLPRLLRRELVRGPLLMCRLTALASDLALLLFIDRGETPFAFLGHVSLLCQ